MQKNRLSYSLILFGIVICTLLILSFIPEITVGDFKFKKVNLLADIQPDPPKLLPKKKSSKKNITKNNLCKPGMTCLEDYSKDKRALHYFFNSLKDSRKRPVRIAFFGDSFIEGDILSASFRDTLQSIFGGRGVGYVPMATEVAQFRTSIQHTFKNWETFSIVGKKSEWSPLCTPGFCFIPLEDNEAEYRPAKKKKPIPFKTIRVFYSNPLKATLDYTVNDSLTYTTELKSSDVLEQTKLNKKNIQSIKLRFNNYDSLKVYGLSFEEPTGVYVDNLAMRGNSGVGLYTISPEMNKQFNAFQNYKLIILQYGLNVVTENDTLGYDWYVDKMVRTVNRLKDNFPKSSILLISVSDRSSNQNGKFRTIPFIPMMRDAQREIAQECGIAFWDLFAAMGGENSMVKFVNAVPSLAAKDHTHLTFKGGNKLAKQLVKVILFERERYAKKKKIHP